MYNQDQKIVNCIGVMAVVHMNGKDRPQFKQKVDVTTSLSRKLGYYPPPSSMWYPQKNNTHNAHKGFPHCRVHKGLGHLLRHLHLGLSSARSEVGGHQDFVVVHQASVRGGLLGEDVKRGPRTKSLVQGLQEVLLVDDAPPCDVDDPHGRFALGEDGLVDKSFGAVWEGWEWWGEGAK